MDTEKIKAGFQLIATSIKTIEFSNTFISFQQDEEELKKSFDVSYEVDEIFIENQQQTILGTITLEVTALIESTEAEMKFEMAIQGCFASEENLEEEAFRNMLELNGCATLYSIARAMILSISSQACYGAHILLPMINVFKLKDSTEL